MVDPTHRNPEKPRLENIYKKLFEQAPFSTIVHDRKGRILEANQAAVRKFGFSREEMIGRNVNDLIGPGYDTGGYRGSGETQDARGHAFMSELKTKDGLRIPAEITASVVEYRGRQLILSSIRDTRIPVESEAEVSNLMAAIEQAAESVHVTDAGGFITFVNPAFENITGYSREEALGKRAVHLLRAEDTPGEHYGSVWSELRKGKIWSGDLRGHTRDGAVFEVEASIAPVRDREDRIVSYVAVMRDVSQEIELERQLRQAQKMEAIGTLAGGIAHDFNNILSAIIGYTELAGTNLPRNSEERKHLQKVLLAGERARDLVKQILTFSRQTEEEILPVDFRLVIKEAFKLLRSSLPSSIKMQQRLSRNIMVLGDPTQLHQVVMNLCTNASQAMMETGGTLTLSLDEVEVKPADTYQPESLPPGTYACLQVSDTGTGMDPAIRERIFEPYFTTKEKGKGTGLGLSVVHGIVKRLAGKITVASEPGRGSTFTLFLPMAHEDAESAHETDGDMSLGFERILVVDDEKILTEMTQQMLERHGYWVETSTDSREALERFKTDPHHYDLVLTDMTMPEMTGDQLAREMLKIRPGLPIVLCTGFSERISEQTASALGISAFAYKPLIGKELARIIRAALDRAPG